MSDVVLSLLVNGLSYTGFKTIDISKSIEDLSGTFTLTMSGAWSDDVPIIKPLSKCVLKLDKEIVITGYVDRVSITIKKDAHEIVITGRDKAADLIDCSVVNTTGQYLGLKVEQIIEQICQPFGIKVSLDAGIDTGLPLNVFAIEQGMSAFEAIQKLCKIRRLLATSDGNGGVLITRAGNNLANTAILEGVNMLKGQADYDFSNRFSIYYCKGQQTGNNNTAIQSIIANVGVATDSMVDRYRPLLIIADAPATTKDCQDRAQWEQAIRLGKSQKYTITVNGWDDPLTNTLWKINGLVTVQSPTLGVKDNLLIMGINYRLSEEGQLTELQLTPASAYQTFEVDTTNAAANAYLQA